MNRSSLSGITDIFFVIDASAIKKFRLFNEVNFQPIGQINGPQSTLNPDIAEQNVELPILAAQLRKFVANTTIQRSDNGSFVPGAGQSFAHRANHVRQTAGLGEWMDFAAGEQNFHAKKSV